MIDKKVLGYLASCSLVLVLGIHLLDGNPEVDDWPVTIIGMLTCIFGLILASIIGAHLLAALPFFLHQVPRKEKVRRCIPFFAVGITLASLLVFAGTRPSYAGEPAAAVSLCTRIKEGTFALDGYRIERKGNRQTETDTVSGAETVYQVRWLSACECELTNTSDPAEIFQVKITAVRRDAYTCVVLGNGRTTKHEIRIIEKGLK